mmetsp:Transcript_67282/g.194594  ORF Transcript_67282/g.194594 Transcript_67282/m.194594 type:complete len:376 (+) Transcript_67282:392-1519(+)
MRHLGWHRLHHSRRNVGGLHLHQQLDRLACCSARCLGEVQHRTLQGLHSLLPHRNYRCHAIAGDRLGAYSVIGANAVASHLRRVPAHGALRDLSEASQARHVCSRIFPFPCRGLQRCRRCLRCGREHARAARLLHAAWRTHSWLVPRGSENGQSVGGLCGGALARERAGLQPLPGQPQVFGSNRLALLLAPKDAGQVPRVPLCCGCIPLLLEDVALDYHLWADRLCTRRLSRGGRRRLVRQPDLEHGEQAAGGEARAGHSVAHRRHGLHLADSLAHRWRLGVARRDDRSYRLEGDVQVALLGHRQADPRRRCSRGRCGALQARHALCEGVHQALRRDCRAHVQSAACVPDDVAEWREHHRRRLPQGIRVDPGQHA